MNFGTNGENLLKHATSITNHFQVILLHKSFVVDYYILNHYDGVGDQYLIYTTKKKLK